MPTGAGKSAGRVSVRVVPDSTGFRQDLLADLQKIERGLEVNVQAKLDDTALKASLEKLRQTAVNIDVQANTAGVRSEIERVSRSGGGVEIPVSLSGANIVRAELIRLATNRVIDLVVNINKRSLVAAGSALATLSGGKSAVGYLKGIGSALGNLDKSVPKIALVAASVGAIGAAGFASVAGTLSLASSLVTVAGAGIALPGILAGAGLAMGTLTVALSTAKTELADLVPTLTKFQDAIGSAFFKKAKGPITDLVNTVTKDLRPAFEGLSGSLGGFAGDLADTLKAAATGGVVAALFERTSAAIDTAKSAIAPLVQAFSTLVDVGSSFLPQLADGFVQVSNQFNDFISQAASDGSLIGWINTGIAGLKSLAGIVGSVGGILKGLFDAANTATGGNGLSVFADALGRISDVVNSSGLQSALSTIFTGAIAGADGLASAIGPIGGLFQTLASTIAGVFETAGTTVGAVLSGIAGALSQPAFASGLTSLFAGIATGVNAILPVLPTLANALGAVLSALGPVAAQLGPVFAASFAAVAPAIAGVVQVLAPLIPILGGALADSISILSVALQALAPIFAAVLSAVAPLIPVLAGALAGAIQTLAPAILSVVQALGGALPSVIAAITATVAVLAPTIAQVLTSLAPLLPVILSLIPPLLQIATAILPLIPQVVASLVPVIAQLVPMIVQILNTILPLIPSLVQLVAAVVQLAATVNPVAQQVFPLFIFALQQAVSVLQFLATIVTAAVQVIQAAFSGNFAAIPGIVLAAFGAALAIVQVAAANMTALISGFASSALARVVSFGAGIVSTISSAFSSFVAKISSGISQAVSLIASLPGKAKSALGNVGSLLYSAGRDLVQGFINGIASMLGALVSAAVNLGKTAVNAAKGALGINSPSRVFRDEVGVQVGAGLIQGINSQRGAVNSAVSGLVSIPQVAGARATAPALIAGAGGNGGGLTLNTGDVVGHSVDALADEIMRRIQRAQYMNPAMNWS